MILNDTSSLLTHLRTRRSGRPRDLIEPGPDAAQLRDIVTMAARVPDHGKLGPWRFVAVPTGARDAFAALLRDAYLVDKPDAGRVELEAVDAFARQAPALVVVVSRPRAESHIPVWEQELSVGAAAMNLLHAAHALGFAGGWVTGWAAYSDRVRDAFGGAGERIAGFVFIGTPRAALEERPRPDIDQLLSVWTG
ncbi:MULTISPECIES: nitroreductase family protein [unclassified Sphingomonas]|uniref:nitroreductase family protein n=1 Tax=unclassified Sphingomonas TaxID=196159 RepID=UPI000A903BEC|nr:MULTISPECIES: nitroreductase [unclassified Sphingomonas]